MEQGFPYRRRQSTVPNRHRDIRGGVRHWPYGQPSPQRRLHTGRRDTTAEQRAQRHVSDYKSRM